VERGKEQATPPILLKRKEWRGSSAAGEKLLLSIDNGSNKKEKTSNITGEEGKRGSYLPANWREWENKAV